MSLGKTHCLSAPKKPGLYCWSDYEKIVLKVFFSHSLLLPLPVCLLQTHLDLAPAVGFLPVGSDHKSETELTMGFLSQTIFVCFMTSVVQRNNLDACSENNKPTNLYGFFFFPMLISITAYFEQEVTLFL